MKRNTEILMMIFLAVYFGEPLVARLMDTTSSTMRQLVFFLLLMSLLRLITVTWLVRGAVSVTVLLALLVALTPHATAVGTVTVAAYGISVALLVRIMVELWHEEK